ncbi:hypothetical protein ACHAXR_008530 [Thalassiosira sp. AJA248-18]
MAKLRSPLLPTTNNSSEDKKEKMKRQFDRISTVIMLVVMTLCTSFVFHKLFLLAHHQPPGFRGLGKDDATEEAAAAEAEGENPTAPFVLPFDLGQRMREWLAKKQLSEGYFFTPPEDPGKAMRPYSTQEIINTIPHFTKELLLVMYAAEADEFIVLLPGKADQPPPVCENGCVRIENIMHAVLYAFRNRYFQRFQPGGKNKQDLLFLVSTGDTPRLSKECYNRPGGCGRRKKFAPILHFGTGFTDESILPSLVVMPPPPNIHLRCMAEWQVSHEVCEFLLPKRVTKDGRETPGLVFGEHINYNVNGNEKKGAEEDEGIFWEDLIPQVVWRGADIPFLSLLHPEMRTPEMSTDVEPKLKEYGRGNRGIVRALNSIYETLRPRWQAVLITAQSEFDAYAKNVNPKRKKKVLPWANIKLTDVDPLQWSKIPIDGEEMSMEEMAKYKYHIDLGGGGGTDWSGTIQKLAMPGLLFHHQTGGVDWFHEHLMPWVHFIPVKEDLSDLKEQFEWAEANDHKARYIAKQGTDFVRRMGRPEGADELYRRHFLKPLEDVIENFKPMKELPPDFLAGGDLIFKEVMRCSGNNVEECRILQ